MSATLIRELQENVAKYGKENNTTLLMLQAIEALDLADAERDRLKAANAELAEALEALLYWDNSKPEFDAARAALAKHNKETA